MATYSHNSIYMEQTTGCLKSLGREHKSPLKDEQIESLMTDDS